MFGKTPKYLLIDIKEIEKKEYIMKRESFGLDLINVYYDQGWFSVRKYFEDNNIPAEFQKIIVEVTGNCFSKNMEEFFMGYHFGESKIKKDKLDASKRIYALGHLFDGNTIIEHVRFNSDGCYMEYEDVVNFFKKLSEKGYLNSYLESLNNLFGLGKNINCLANYSFEENVFKKCKIKKRPKK